MFLRSQAAPAPAGGVDEEAEREAAGLPPMGTLDPELAVLLPRRREQPWVVLPFRRPYHIALVIIHSKYDKGRRNDRTARG